MTDREIIIEVLPSKALGNLKEFADFLRALPEGRHHVTVRDYRKMSPSQRGYYRGTIVPLVRKALYEEGWEQMRNDEVCHEYLLSMFSTVLMTNKATGEQVKMIQRTSSMTVSEMTLYIEDILRWAAEYLSLYIPSPNEQLIMFRKWAKEIGE